ncbi:MAG: hypothetical protein ACTSQG_06335 [Promethearchaeota archaeon]
MLFGILWFVLLLVAAIMGHKQTYGTGNIGIGLFIIIFVTSGFLGVVSSILLTSILNSVTPNMFYDEVNSVKLLDYNKYSEIVVIKSRVKKVKLESRRKKCKYKVLRYFLFPQEKSYILYIPYIQGVKEI